MLPDEPVKKFQFLMVRLKVNCLFSKFCFLLVSIPYGTIKSSRSTRMSTPTFVSIPYGTIKRKLKYLL